MDAFEMKFDDNFIAGVVIKPKRKFLPIAQPVTLNVPERLELKSR